MRDGVFENQNMVSRCGTMGSEKDLGLSRCGTTSLKIGRGFPGAGWVQSETKRCFPEAGRAEQKKRFYENLCGWNEKS